MGWGEAKLRGASCFSEFIRGLLFGCRGSPAALSRRSPSGAKGDGRVFLVIDTPFLGPKSGDWAGRESAGGGQICGFLSVILYPFPYI